MHILLVNPNTTAGLSDLLATAGRVVAAPGTTLVPLTAARGVPYISSRAEAQIGGAIALEMLAEHHAGADAAVLAAFGEPGLLGARELFNLPVVGMGEAAMLTACMLGRKFAIITFAAGLGPWYQECVEMHGLSSRCAAVRTIDSAFKSIMDVQGEKERLLVDLALKTVSETQADVVIPAGAPLAGLADKIKGQIPVPVVDPIQAAVKLAEALVALKPNKASAGSFSRPEAKVTIGLAEVLARRIEHKDR